MTDDDDSDLRSAEDMPPFGEPLKAGAMLDVLGHLNARLAGMPYTPDPSVRPEDLAKAALYYLSVAVWTQYDDWSGLLQAWADIVTIEAIATVTPPST